MKEFIASFIDQKELSENSQSAYFYDLDQFVESIHGKVTPTNLRIYQASIKDFKPAVQKRKLSAVNQFLYYLYQERFISEYHRLVLPKIQPAKTHDRELLDLTHFWEESTNPQGRLMALLILEMGLLPSEILQVKVEDIQLDFHVIRVGKDGQKRVLKVPEPLLDELQLFLDGVYLFDNKGNVLHVFSCFRISGGVYIPESGLTCLRRGARFRISGLSDCSLFVFGLVFV